MKKAKLIIVLGLLWCNVGFAGVTCRYDGAGYYRCTGDEDFTTSKDQYDNIKAYNEKGESMNCQDVGEGEER